MKREAWVAGRLDDAIRLARFRWGTGWTQLSSGQRRDAVAFHALGTIAAQTSLDPNENADDARRAKVGVDVAALAVAVMTLDEEEL